MTKYSLIKNFNGSMNRFFDKIVKDSNIESFISKRLLEVCSIYLLLLSYFCNDMYIILNVICSGLFWLILGILSSIGFGTGLQTGLLFVMPKVIEVAKSVSLNYNNQTYNNDSYQTYNNDSCQICSNTDYLDYSNHSNYNNKTEAGSNDIRSLFYYCYIECIWFVFIWGIGSALGELPPYYIAKNINLKDKKATNKLFNLLGDNKDIVKKTVDNLTTKLKQNSTFRFYTIVALSAWPNALFDMCGVAAGMVKLPVLEFLIPTIIGKAFIKCPIQLGFVIYSYLTVGENLKNNEGLGYLYWCWIVLVISFTLYFLKEAIENYINQ